MVLTVAVLIRSVIGTRLTVGARLIVLRAVAVMLAMMVIGVVRMRISGVIVIAPVLRRRRRGLSRGNPAAAPRR